MRHKNDLRPSGKYVNIKADRNVESECFHVRFDPQGVVRKKIKLKVYRQGNSFIGVIPREGKKGIKRTVDKDPKKLAFRKYYVEAQKLRIPKNQLVDYLWEKMFNNEESYLLDREDIVEMIKKEANRIHQKKKRYREKLGFFRPNWFVTFTYADSATDPESFERKLRRALSNLANRKGWRYIGAKEHGSEKGRLHFHFIMYIPEGGMIGELFKDYHWNGFKREYFTNNTYFHERFGDCEFVPISGCDLMSGRLSSYLVKYIEKEDSRLIYSRHLSTRIEMEVYENEDIFMTFYDYSRKVYLALELFFSDDELKYLGVDEFLEIDPEGMGYNREVAYKRPAFVYEKAS